MLPAVFAALYSLAAHWAIARDQPEIPLAMLSTVATLLFVRGAWRRRAWLLPLTVAVAGGIVLWRGPSAALAALSATPVIIHLSLLWVFARSLRPGRTALITRIAVHMQQDDAPELLAYTRAVTQMWCGFFALMAATAALLAVLAPPVVWSAFANGISYCLVALVFLGEYLVRIRVLPPQHHSGLLTFLRDLRRVDLRALSRVPRHD